MELQCINCHKEISFEVGTSIEEKYCQFCNQKFHVAKNYINYDFDKILNERFSKKYFLNKVLNNNGYLSYLEDKESSLSLPDREDVKRFKDYIDEYGFGRTILDIGCGPLPRAGYVNSNKWNSENLYGLDVIEGKDYHGSRIVGCAEFIPCRSKVFDTVIFATSLDHVCDLETTIEETHRVLSEDGVVILWVSERYRPIVKEWKRACKIYKYLTPLYLFLKMVWRLFKNLKNNNSFFYNIFHERPYKRYWPSKNMVYYVPPGGIDPFHSYYENPPVLVKLFRQKGFIFINYTNNGANEVFLTFKKQK